MVNKYHHSGVTPPVIIHGQYDGSHTTVHVRFGPKATVADQNVIRRFVPRVVIPD
jgi:hypothetical protein